MKLSLDARDLSEVRTDALIVGRHSDEAKLTPAFRAVDEKLGGLLSKVLAVEKFEGKPGQVSHVHTDGRLRAARVLVAGLGPRKSSTADGHWVKTFSEPGMPAKIGLNSAGLSINFNILHHTADSALGGVPVHVVARRILGYSSKELS